MYGYPKVVNVLKDFNMPKASTSKASLPKKAKVVNKQKIQKGIRANLDKKHQLKWQARPASNKARQEKHDQL